MFPSFSNSYQSVCFLLLIGAFAVNALGIAALVRDTPPGVHRVECHLLPNQTDEGLVAYAWSFLSRPDGNYQSVSVTREPHLSEADVFINVTFGYTDTDPPYDEVVSVQAVDTEAPVIGNIPTQPDHIPASVACLHAAHKLAGSDVWARYYSHFYCKDRCSPTAACTYGYSLSFDGCRNRGRLALHFGSDDLRGNTDGATLNVPFADYTGPTLRKFAVDHYAKHNTHSRHCVYGARKTAMCPATLLRSIATKLMEDNCDSEEEHLKARITRVYQKKRGQNMRTWWPVADGGVELIPRGNYEAGTLLRVELHGTDSCKNACANVIIEELYFVDTEAACKELGWLSVPASDYSSTPAEQCF